MTQIGINVPPGFVITTEACLEYLDGDRLPAELMDEVRAQLAALEEDLAARVEPEPATRSEPCRATDTVASAEAATEADQARTT